MKKLLSFMMLMMLMSFTFTSCSDDDDNDIEVPQTVEQAKAMLKGQWQYKNYNPTLHPGTEAEFDDYAEDGKYYVFYKVAEDAPDGYWYSEYKGQYVGYTPGDTYSFEPDENDPTNGTIRLGTTHHWRYNELKKNEVYQDWDLYIRPSKHISYKVVEKTW